MINALSGAAVPEKALAQNAEIMAAVSEQLDFSAVTIPPGYWESAPGGRHVFGASNVIEGDAKKENFEAMHQAWVDYKVR